MDSLSSIQKTNSVKQIDWKEKNIKTFGVDLSFADVPEYQRTKYVHRLHPYLGKFIPQLVEVFLKKYFKEGQLILDPFVGSGTTLIEANILNINSIGIELSEFSYLISKVKTQKYNIELLKKEILDILNKTKEFSKRLEKNQELLFKNTFNIEPSEYFKTWYHPRATKEIYFYKNLIPNYKNQDILKIIISRAARSARQIPHYDLARPKKPIKERYWCIKHKRYCEPVNNAIKFINRYSLDSIKRIEEFNRIRTSAKITLLKGDSRIIKLPTKEKQIDGIFTSPPYLGLIDYHDQHKYAYDLFGFKEYSEFEIGSPNKNGNNIKNRYKKDITACLKNIKNYMKPGAKIFIVVNDKYNLYPEIAKECNLKFVDVFYRPVLMRTERDNNKFSENIYYFVNK
ncbi:MAG: DNA methyltransferase [Candidatus Pacebacteria bacterium]|nr:DNA methyltransferase [Candidatus Paceibacterota bacterium]